MVYSPTTTGLDQRGEGPTRNRLVLPVLVLLFGLAMMAFGAWFASGLAVNCDQRVMHPGDTCKQPKQPVRTYEEQRNLDQTMGWVVLGVGSVVTIGGTAWAIWAYRRPPRTPGSLGPAGGPGSYPPPGAPPSYPPQYPPSPGGQPYYPPPHYPPPPGPQR